MDKNDYKELVGELMRKDAEHQMKIEELELKLDQQTQDFHFDMRNAQMELVMLQNRLDTLTQGFDDLERENKELRKDIARKNTTKE